MFWRFGFQNGSSIDTLLDKEDVSLEAILDEDDLLQECKAQNTRLIDYFQRVDVLQRLLGYVTGQIEDEEPGGFKYPYVATEVLCSEIWSIVETCINHSDQLLNPFWETVLDRPPEDMKTHMVMASHFAKINAVFLNKKPAEMLQFILAQPNIVERLLQHIETPSFSDLLIRIIQLDEQPAGAEVLEWLSKERLMARLIERLSPSHSSDMHNVVSELIKGIISMAAPSPGAALSEGLQNGPASNRFARELARRDNVQTLLDYILFDFGPETGSSPSQEGSKAEEGDADAEGDSYPKTPTLPTTESATSSVVHSICIIIELIRQNNSDFFEPYLFHTLRNRLIQVQQQLTTYTPDEGREALEQAMQEMVDRMGVVHLGPVLELFCDVIEKLQSFLRKPRSFDGPVLTSLGSITPLTFERYRICELYAELLHCSSMSLLNRSPEFNHLYDSEGRLQGGLAALGELAQVIAMGSGTDGEHDAMDEGADDVEPALELPVHGSQDSSSLLDSDEEMSDGDGPGSDDDPMEDIPIYDEPKSMGSGSAPSSPGHVRSPAEPSSAASSPSVSKASPISSSPGSPSVSASPQRKSTGSDVSTIGRKSGGSRRSSRRLTVQDFSSPDIPLPVGERLKQKLLDAGVLSTMLDLFFEFPWNNFLHSVVYDLIHQILTGRIDEGVNRSLAISLFKDARLMQRIIEGQKRNDEESSKPKGVRLGYMGHLTIISEDVIVALEHFPPELRLVIEQCIPQPEWDDYVGGRYNETKKKDSSLLGGGKPVVNAGPGRPSGQWQVDEEDAAASSAAAGASTSAAGAGEASEVRGEFHRATGSRPTRESSADFGPAPFEEEEDYGQAEHPQFARYLAQEMHSGDEYNGSSSSDNSDEEDGGWLAQSHFEIDHAPPVSARPHNTERRPLSANGFDDTFAPSSDMSISSPFSDPFAAEEDDDDAFGPFSDAAAASGTDPFNFPSNLSEEAHDTSFDSFGDFGEFRSGGDGDTTPTAGSWTFASSSSTGSADDASSGSEDFAKAADEASAEKSEAKTEGESDHPST